MSDDTPTNPNRIPNPPVTVANAETDARLAIPKPGEGGWTPPSWANFAAALGIGVLMSVGSVVALPGLTVPVLMGAAMTGLASGLATYFGMRSAGTRKPE